MWRKDVVESYLWLLQKGESRALIGLFAETGVVVSPLYGRKPAAPFYHDLDQQTCCSELTSRGIYLHAEDPLSAVLAFHYHWTLRDGKEVGFECVDLFRFDQERKITELEIVYDTHPVRAALTRAGNSGSG